MAWILSELVIESSIREGLANVRNDLTIVDDVFDQLLSLPVSPKYGTTEITKIKNLVAKSLPIIHSFPAAESKVPCISIQLLSAQEFERHDVLDDFAADQERDMTAAELNAQIIVDPVLIINYDTYSGIVLIDDSVDLTNVHANQILVDANNNEFEILGGVNNDLGSKQVIIQKQADLTIGTGSIKTIFDMIQTELRANIEHETIIIGIHSKEALTTKYLYTLIKYFLESRKIDLIRRGFTLPTYEGSDFTRNAEYQADYVYTRYLTIRGRIENTWTSDKVTPIDLIDLDLRVEKDIATNEELNLEDQTIKVTDN